MKKIALLAPLLLLAVSAFAADPADYPETLHVTASHLVFDASNNTLIQTQRLEVITKGSKYELLGPAVVAHVRVAGGVHIGLLPPGNYRAKLIRNPNAKPDYLLFLTYEILLPDGKTAKFDVIGVTE